MDKSALRPELKPAFRALQDYRKTKPLLKLLQAIIALSLFTIVLGSWVRAADAGLSCPDWPLCYDRVVPIFNTQIFLEWFHRVSAALVSLLLVVFGIWILSVRILRKAFQFELLAAFILLAVQVVLGGLTVLQLVNPGIVSIHLLNALLFLTIVIWMHEKLQFAHAAEVHGIQPQSAIFCWGAAIFSFLLLVQIGWGGAVSTSQSGLACPDFPTCFGKWWIPLDVSWGAFLQIVHRLNAYFIFGLAVLGTLWAAFRARDLLARTLWVQVLILVQIFLGIVNVYEGLPAWASVAHLANAVLIFYLSVQLTCRLRWRLYFLMGGQQETASTKKWILSYE